MTSMIWDAAAWMRGAQTMLDTVGHNLANVSTPGFQPGRVDFAEALRAELASDTSTPGSAGPARTAGGGLQLGDALAAGTASAAGTPALRELELQGLLQPTGRPHDLALEGPGAFRVALPGGGESSTRNGAFARDALGRVVSPEGGVLLVKTSSGEAPLILRDEEALVVGPDGAVSGTTPGTAPRPLGRLALAGDDGSTRVRQYALEGSAVDVGAEMGRLLIATRSFQLAARALRTGDEMMEGARNLLSR